MSVQSNTVHIDEHGIPNTISINRVTHAPSITDQIQRTTTLAQPGLELSKDNTTSEARDIQSEKDAYVVDRIVRRIGKGNGFRHVVRWYGSRPKSNTVEMSRPIINILSPAKEDASIKRLSENSRMRHNLCTIRLGKEAKRRITILRIKNYLQYLGLNRIYIDIIVSARRTFSRFLRTLRTRGFTRYFCLLLHRWTDPCYYYPHPTLWKRDC